MKNSAYYQFLKDVKEDIQAIPLYPDLKEGIIRVGKSHSKRMTEEVILSLG
jgi:hypothetical protein